MAGFKKSAVIDALGKTLRDEREASQKRHEQKIAEIKQSNGEARDARKRLESDAKKVANGKLSVEKFVEQVKGSFSWRSSPEGVYSGADQAEAKLPELEESQNEKNIDRAICIMKAFEGDVVSVPQLKELGILGWVKRSWSNA